MYIYLFCSFGFVVSDLDADLTRIAETALSISSSVASYSSEDDSIWDRQDECSNASTLLSSLLDDDASVVHSKDNGDYPSP
ncbi:hypothetical protein B0H63DRAFT_93168 [Podospora didyma]|uniref:Uncharacterized protein n=1 Tax=Podospora didyma TaxID=330526 RepID=A0AAE0N0Q5_9PEZI|nr:hypothetical protein B0H63DRAFT_93168 [Podospora didyma]